MIAQIDWPGLVLRSLQAPREAARQIIDWRIPPQAIWMSLVLVCTLNALLAGVTELLFPTPFALPGMMQSPIGMVGILAVGLFAMVYALFWVGRSLGAEGRLEDVAAALTWLQGLRVLAQAILLVLTILSPALAGLFAFAVMIFGIWLTLNFVAEALQFTSLLQAAGVLFAVVVGLAIGLMVVLTVTGLGVWGLAPNV